MLKILACLFMLLDHIGYYFAYALPENVVFVLRTAGRLAFPIFAWSVARGYTRTRNPLRYFIRMVLFAGFAELIIRQGHRLAGLTSHGTNVMVTFALAIVLVTGYRIAAHSILDMIASLRPISPTPTTLPAPRFDVRINIKGITLDPRIAFPLGLLMGLAAISLTIWLQPDYSLYGIGAVLLFYIIHDVVPEASQELRAMQVFVIFNLIFVPIRVFLMHWPADWSILQTVSILALPICYRLDQNHRPHPVFKYGIYIFYPLHIFLLCLLRMFIA